MKVIIKEKKSQFQYQYYRKARLFNYKKKTDRKTKKKKYLTYCDIFSKKRVGSDECTLCNFFYKMNSKVVVCKCNYEKYIEVFEI